MHKSFVLRRRSSYPFWFAGMASLAVVIFCFLPEKFQLSQLLISIMSGVAAFFYFLYSQHSINTDRFIKLFQEFNVRYERLSDRLNALVQSNDEPFIRKNDLQVLYDYFNLCAEEYFYFCAGYIDTDVWHAWLNGMRHFAKHAEVRRIWQRELDQGSYYGFSLRLVEPIA